MAGTPRQKRKVTSASAEQTTTAKEESTANLASAPESETSKPPSVSGLVNGATARPAVEDRERITFLLTPDGGIDMDAMRQKTRDKLQAAILKTGGLVKESSRGPAMRMPDEAISAVYNVLGTIEAMVASRKYPADICADVFHYSEMEIAVLMEPTQRVVGKYVPKLNGFEDETALVLVLVQVHFAKMHRLRMLMNEREAVAAVAGKPNQVTQ